jgi:DNA-binding NtrC family response regulator
MKVKEVIVLDNDTPQSQNLISFLKDNAYTATSMNSMAKMDRYMADMAETECRAVVLSLDNIAVTNKILRDLKRKKPSLNIIAHSKRQFHPELEEALREYISVCLAEPVDTDELDYWLKSVFENNESLNG